MSTPQTREGGELKLPHGLPLKHDAWLAGSSHETAIRTALGRKVSHWCAWPEETTVFEELKEIEALHAYMVEATNRFAPLKAAHQQAVNERCALLERVKELEKCLRNVPPCDVSMDASFVYKTSGWKWAEWNNDRTALLASPPARPATQPWAEAAAREYLGNPGGSESDEDAMYHQCDIDDLTKCILKFAPPDLSAARTEATLWQRKFEGAQARLIVLESALPGVVEALLHAGNIIEHCKRHDWGGNFPQSLKETLGEVRGTETALRALLPSNHPRNRARGRAYEHS